MTLRCGLSGAHLLGAKRGQVFHVCMCGRRVKLRRPLIRSKGTYRGMYRAAIMPTHNASSAERGK